MVTLISGKDALSHKGLGQRLYEKNVALGDRIRKSVQGKLITDLNAWHQMRDNFEAIILGDPPFSFTHNIEEALWRLHYQRIEGYRAYIRRAALPAESGVLDDPVAASGSEIHSQFKAFLSEASGFYHDLIVKLRDKYGLPKTSLPEEPFHQNFIEKDVKTYAEMKTGLVSWHRCLICLGDLARYKTLHDNESGTLDYSEASGYYLQASSIWPSSGHSHHQLAIVASYLGEEFMEVYWYFRSLAVECPISTTRETLILLFEKNRHNYLQLPDNRASSALKGPKPRVKGKFEVRRQPREKTKTDANLLKRNGNNVIELFKPFCIRFVRLSGIIFTRLSLETFADVLARVSRSFEILLSHGPEEKLNFGKDENENRLFIVRLVAILIFTVDNTKSPTSKDQSHMHRREFLHSACTAAFLLMGTIFKRFTELRDSCSSYLFPGILIFLEWLANCPDVASGKDADEAEGNARSVFWNQHVKFLNKLVSSGLLSVDAAEYFFIHGRNTHERDGLGMRHSLWEDFELRGFLPLRASQMNLQYSRDAYGRDELKESKARVKRVLATCKVLVDLVRVNGKEICYDPEVNKFIFGTSTLAKNKSNAAENSLEKNAPSKDIQSLKLSDEEEEDEVIVFKPNPLRFATVVNSTSIPEGQAQRKCFVDFSVKHQLNSGDPPVPPCVTAPQNLHPVPSSASDWSLEQTSSINDIVYLGFLEDKPIGHSGMSGYDNSSPSSSHMLNQQLVNTSTTEFFNGPEKYPNPVKSTMVGNAAYYGKMEDSYLNPNETFEMNSVRKPSRHHGPPPGFGVHPKKYVSATICSEDGTDKNGMLYSCSDPFGGYQSSSSMLSMGLNAGPQVGSSDHRVQGEHLNQIQHGITGSNNWRPF